MLNVKLSYGVCEIFFGGKIAAIDWTKTAPMVSVIQRNKNEPHSWVCYNSNIGEFRSYCTICAPPKSKMEPEDTPLEKEKYLQTTSFWVPAVSFPGCKVFDLMVLYHMHRWCSSNSQPPQRSPPPEEVMTQLVFPFS